GEFRRQFDEALKEAELDDVRDIINDAKSLDPRSDIRKVFDPVRTMGEEIRSSLKDATSTAQENVAVPDPSAPGAAQLQPQVMERAAAPAQAAAQPAAAAEVKKPAARSRKATPAAKAEKTTAPKASGTKKAATPAATPKPAKAPAKQTTRKKAADAGTKSRAK